MRAIADGFNRIVAAPAKIPGPAAPGSVFRDETQLCIAELSRILPARRIA